MSDTPTPPPADRIGELVARLRQFDKPLFHDRRMVLAWELAGVADELADTLESLRRERDGFKQEASLLRDHVRKFEPDMERLERYERELDEIGKAMGCDHKDDGYMRCVRDQLARAESAEAERDEMDGERQKVVAKLVAEEEECLKLKAERDALRKQLQAARLATGVVKHPDGGPECDGCGCSQLSVEECVAVMDIERDDLRKRVEGLAETLAIREREVAQWKDATDAWHEQAKKRDNAQLLESRPPSAVVLTGGELEAVECLRGCTRIRPRSSNATILMGDALDILALIDRLAPPTPPEGR